MAVPTVEVRQTKVALYRAARRPLQGLFAIGDFYPLPNRNVRPVCKLSAVLAENAATVPGCMTGSKVHRPLAAHQVAGSILAL